MAGKVLARHGSAVPHSALPYNERLDGIRAIAIGFVVFAHYFPSLNHLAPFAPLGVRIFFVLSGYLITRILLDARADSELLRGDELKFALLSFYARRALREPLNNSA
jgi:peptidoglycan/LPS O-acetylase OafA/YrhL